MESGGHPVSTVIRLKFVVLGSYKLTSKTGVGVGERGGAGKRLPYHRKEQTYLPPYFSTPVSCALSQNILMTGL